MRSQPESQQIALLQTVLLGEGYPNYLVGIYSKRHIRSIYTRGYTHPVRTIALICHRC